MPAAPPQMMLNHNARRAALAGGLRRGVVFGLVVGLVLSGWIVWHSDDWRSPAEPAAAVPATVEPEEAETFLLALQPADQATVDLAESLERRTSGLDTQSVQSRVPGADIVANLGDSVAPYEAVAVVHFTADQALLRRSSSVAALGGRALEALSLVPVAPPTLRILDDNVRFDNEKQLPTRVYEGRAFQGDAVRSVYLYQPFSDVVIVVSTAAQANADDLIGIVTDTFPPPDDPKAATRP